MSQELYAEYGQLTQKIQLLTQQLQSLEQNHAELEMLVDAIKNFSNLKKGEKILAPIANGIFIDATLNDNSFFKINVGGGAIVSKSTEETIDMLEKQLGEITIVKAKTRDEYASVIAKLQTIEHQVQSGLSQMNNNNESSE